MPNRVLRNWTMSQRVDQLSLEAELFLTRLIMTVDDYGTFYASPKLLRANLYPLRLDTVQDADINRWVAECQAVGIITAYTVEDKAYINIAGFDQQLRRKKRKYPAPPGTTACEETPPTPPPGDEEATTPEAIYTEENNADTRPTQTAQAQYSVNDAWMQQCLADPALRNLAKDVALEGADFEDMVRTFFSRQKASGNTYASHQLMVKHLINFLYKYQKPKKPDDPENIYIGRKTLAQFKRDIDANEKFAGL